MGWWGWAAKASERGTGRNRRGWSSGVEYRGVCDWGEGSRGGVINWDCGIGVSGRGISGVDRGGGCILYLVFDSFFNVVGRGGGW